MAETQLRDTVEREAGLELHVDGSKFRFLPPRVVLAGVVVSRRGEPWVLTVEETELSIGFRSIFFRQGGGLRVKMVNPSYFERRSRPAPGAAPPAGPAGAARPAAAAAAEGRRSGLSSLLTAGAPIRSLEITGGELRREQGRGESLRLGGIRLSALRSRGRLAGRVGIEEGRLLRRGARWELGSLESDFTADVDALTIGKLTVDSPLAKGRVAGRVDYAGTLALEGTLSASVGAVTERLGRGRPLEGTLSFTGKVAGKAADPVVEGRVALTDPVYGQKRWPGLKGTIRWEGRKLSWNDVALATGEGRLLCEGALDLAGDVPRYSLSVEAVDVEPATIPVVPGTRAAALHRVSAVLGWEGSGFDLEEAAGSGSLKGSFALDGWSAGDLSLDAGFALDAGVLSVLRFDMGGGPAAMRGTGSYGLDGSLDAELSVDTGEISDLAGAWGVKGAGGRIFLAAAVSNATGELSVTGPFRWLRGELYGLSGLEAAGTLLYSKGSVRVAAGELRWRNSQASLDGTAFLRERKIDLLMGWENLRTLDLTALLGAKEERVDGVASLQGRLLGDWEAPILSGRFAAQGLRYGEVRVETAGGNLTLSRGRVRMSEVELRSGTSTLSFAGELFDGRRLSGSFGSADFNLRSFVPDTAADAAGEIHGSLGGTIEAPQMKGRFHVSTLTYENLNFKGGDGGFEYGGGVFTLDGILAEPENSYRLSVGFGGSWPFEASVDLGRFSPEVAREGFSVLPEKVRQSLEGFSFLAIGSMRAAGELDDPASIVASLDLETVWLYTRGQTLQNRSPLSVSWERGTLKVENFALVGEDYLVSIGGSGGEEGWDLLLEGKVDLAIFERYWEEIEAIDAPGDVSLRLGGAWESPLLTGTIRFREGELKLRSFADPIAGISGTVELGEGFVRVSEFSGTMGENAFAAGGTWSIDRGEVDAFVEGRLDLSLFKSRIPGAREVRGPVEARLSLKGPASRPGILGEAELKGVEIFHQSVPQKLTSVTGKVIFGEKRVELLDVAGNMGEGTVGLTGSVDWGGGAPAFDLAFRGRKVVLVLEGTAKALLDADLTLRGEAEEMKLAGTVDFLRARYYREFRDKIEKLPGGFGGRGEEKGKDDRGRKLLEKMALDIDVAAADRFWVVNSMVELENSVNLHVGGTVKAPQLDGEVRLLRGEVTYYARRFTLYSGRIFNAPPGVNPVVEAQAEVLVNDTRIYLLLEGPLRKPTLQLTSLPPMSQEDLIALLTVGYTRSDLGEQQEGALAIGAAIVFSTPVIEQLGEGAREATGIEMLQVEPAFGEEGAAARVTVGSRLSDRLFMSASQAIGVTDDQQVRLEYQVFDYMSLLGQQLRQGIFSLDVVFQLSFY